MTARKRLEGNGLWESSRMMLPEHKEAINLQSKEDYKRTKPVIDEQELEFIELALMESFHEAHSIIFRLFGEYEDIMLSGIVVLMHISRRSVKISTSLDEWEWIQIEDILSVTT